ncbi:MAG TPA: hypothetical protein VK445_10570, partial [Dissulfurispiraceae bacterium]|nr:hypothetical protein [Dissulfurispiraceae bacterium]
MAITDGRLMIQMAKIIAALGCVASLFLAGASSDAASPSKQPSPAAGAKTDNKEPIVITSLTLLADNVAKTATFEGNVIARK